jgi:hypothetical protein
MFLHSIRSKINIASSASSLIISTTTEDLFMWRTFQDLVGYPRILDELRPLRGRHAYKASLRSAPPDSLQPCWEIWVPLHFVQPKPWLSFLIFLEHQTSHAVCFNGRGLLYECVFDTLLFSLSYRPIGKPISHHVVTRPTFSSLLLFGPSYRPSCLPRCSDTTHECIFGALQIFSSSFRSIGILLPIGRHSTSLRSARLQIGRLLRWLVLFSFWPTCMLLDLSIALRLRHDLSKVAAPTPHSGACETRVSLGPHRPGSQPSPTSGSGLLEDLPTCLWAQLT